LRAVITAISAIAKMPLAKIKKKMIIISPPIPDIAYAPLPYQSRRDGYWKTIQLDALNSTCRGYRPIFEPTSQNLSITAD
jgi:hypothetical protein